MNYRFGTPAVFIIPYVIVSLMAITIFVCLLYDAIFNSYYEWGGLLISLIFSFIGLCGLVVRPKKYRTILEEHLHKICFSKK